MRPVKVGILLQLLSLTIKNIHGVDFHVDPSGVILVPLIEMVNVTFNCSVNSGKLFWSVTNQSRISLNTQGPRDIVTLNRKGITFTFSSTFASITIPGVVENNETVIFCGANINGINEFSSDTPIILKILGPPLPPDPKLTFHFPYTLEVHWTVPFSHDTVQGYNLQIIISESSRSFVELDTLVLYNDTSYNFSFTNQETALNCHILTINVTATSEKLGESTPGTVSRGFPTAPQQFQSEVKIDVTFLTGCTPIIVEVRFEAPFICSFQRSNFTITIEDISSHGSKLSAVTRQSNYTGKNRTISEIFESEIYPNKNYTLTIDVVDDSFPFNRVSASKNFSTIFDPVGITPGTSSDSHLMEIVLYAGTFGGIGLMIIIILLVIIVILIIVCSKTRNEKV